MGKNVVTEEQLKDSQRLKAIYTAKRKDLNLTQEKLGVALGGSGQSTASNYLNGITALNLKAALIFASELGVEVSEFSPTLADLVSSSPATQKNNAIDRIADKINGFTPSELRELEAQVELILTRKNGGF